jgi:hypothetical protein
MLLRLLLLPWPQPLLQLLLQRLAAACQVSQPALQRDYRSYALVRANERQQPAAARPRRSCC